MQTETPTNKDIIRCLAPLFIMEMQMTITHIYTPNPVAKTSKKITMPSMGKDERQQSLVRRKNYRNTLENSPTVSY